MYYPRKIEDKISKHLDNKKAIILTGMRRTGKTTLLGKFYKEIKENKLWFDFENPLDVKYFEDIDYKDIYQNFLNEGLDKNKRIYIFIDEVQHFPDVSKIVKYLSDHYNIKFFLTGSASYYLKNLFPESLAGRKVLFEVFPLDFEEFLIFKGEDIDKYNKIKKKKNITEIDYERYDKLYEEYFKWGGFPEVVLEKKISFKYQILKDIFSSYYQNEIINLADYRKNKKIRDLILLLADRVGSQLDIVKLASELGITRTTVYSYLSFLNSTYFIHLIPPYSKNAHREVSGSQKVYFCDNGILNIITQLNKGQLLENAVFNQLKARGEVSYLRKKTGAEIDFILNKNEAFEVKNKASQVDVERFKRNLENLDFKKTAVLSKKYVNLDSVVFCQFL